MLHLADIKARLPRLRQRIEGLAQEIHLWQTVESPLLPLERRSYLIGLHEALAGLDNGLVVLEKAAHRIKEGNLSGLK